MEQDTTVLAGGWLWGALWVVYAYFYGRYFGHVSKRLQPDLEHVSTPGSWERLKTKQVWCYRFATFMLIPTFLETIRTSFFTSVVISILPCLFGIWVMHAVWRDVLNAKVPVSSYINRQRR